MKIRTVVIAVAAAACVGFLTKSTQAQGPLTNNLFSQYYDSRVKQPDQCRNVPGTPLGPDGKWVTRTTLTSP